MSKLQKFIQNPREIIRPLILRMPWLPDSWFARLYYYAETGKTLNLKNPHTLNEKLQWLKLHDHNPKYTLLVDKLKVKEYISKIIGNKYVIPLLGVWDCADKIDFDSLPNQFVMKCNHTSAFGNTICRDKTKLDLDLTRSKLDHAIKQDYYKTWREWPYKNVERKIFAEEFISNSDGSPIVDYKFYCYGGKPVYFMYSVGEADHHVRNHKFDMNCKSIDYLFKKKEAISLDEIHLPSNFDEMKAIVEKLCVGYPHVRIDLYNVDGKIYFGEITFYSSAGMINIDSAEFSQQLADMIDINSIKNG